MRFGRFCQYLFSFVFLFVLLVSVSVCGIKIESDTGSLIFKNQMLRSAYASGSGTSSNFKDPVSSEEVAMGVLGGDSVSNNWVSTTWSYYAHGFGADVTEEGDLFTGVWATAQVSHGKVGETQSNQYVYDGVSASSRSVFEFTMIPLEDEGNLFICDKVIPTNIIANLILEVSGSEKEDMGRAQAVLYLEHINKLGRTSLIRYGEFTRMIVVGEDEPKTYPRDVWDVDWPKGWGAESSEGQVSLNFNNISINCNERYRIRMYVTAGAYSVFRASDTSSESSASAFMDPNIEISSDFEYADKIKMVVSEGVIDEDLALEPKIVIDMEQGGIKVTKVDVEGGDVTLRASSELGSVDETKFLWSAMASGFYDKDGDYFDEVFRFDPSQIQLGPYAMHLITFPPLDPSRGSLSFEVVSGLESDNEGEDGIGLYLPVAGVLLVFVVGFVVWFYVRSKRKS